jgi:cellulose synthase/poly-beta-1,6-N-acetylglucosamine synthase-like glycosyltransferase
MVSQILFWAAAALLAYAFIGYQVVISMLARLKGRRAELPSGSAPQQVTVLVVAFNEEARIRARIENLRESRLPVEVAICSDGSTDSTVAEATQAGARVFDFPIRRGKAACLDEALRSLDAEIVVLADARQEFTPETIPRLVAHFADPAIGAVSGLLRIGDASTAAGAGVNAYWKMETAIRQAESDFDSCIGCTGAVYAVRRALAPALPADTILDDVVIPMGISLGGHRVIYDSSALAFDPQPLDPRSETRRKARTLAGNFQMLVRHPVWLNPFRNRLAWQLFSHKYLRLAGPLLLAVALGSNAALATIPFYRACLAVQVALYLLAIAGLAIPYLRGRLFSIPAGFLFLNLMTLRGFCRFVLGRSGGAWESGNRAPQSPG